jgi:TonB family protein
MTASLSLTTFASSSLGDRQLGKMLAVSLGAHLALYLMVSFMQWAPPLRPMESQEVTLVSLPDSHAWAASAVRPTPAPPVVAPQTVEPPPVRATPAPQVDVPTAVSVTPPVSPSAESRTAIPPPAPTPSVSPVRPRTLKELIGEDLPALPSSTVATTPKPDSLVRELLRGVELPPEAPKLGEEIPASTTPSKTSKGFESSLKNLSVPKVPKLTSPAPPPSPPTKPIGSVAPPPPSLNSLVTQELQKPPVLSKPAPPVVAAKPPTIEVQKPALEIRSQGSSPGQSRYLALVQQRISQYWTPTDVQAAGQSLRVRLKFRLSPNGAVSNLSIEQSSGESYYDLAGQRAVLSAVPLPPFPPELKEAWLDVHISFTVGEGAG